jgi:hypothetical protein
VGSRVGPNVGSRVGPRDGMRLGGAVGITVGSVVMLDEVGTVEGGEVGAVVGKDVGVLPSTVGEAVGLNDDGEADGRDVRDFLAARTLVGYSIVSLTAPTFVGAVDPKNGR